MLPVSEACLRFLYNKSGKSILPSNTVVISWPSIRIIAFMPGEFTCKHSLLYPLNEINKPNVALSLPDILPENTCKSLAFINASCHLASTR